MRRSLFIFCHVFLILGLLGISIIGNSQDQKLNKKEHKDAKKAEKIKNFEALGVLLESRKFLFEANQKQNKEGKIVIVSPGLNYLKIDLISSSSQFETAGDEWMPDVKLTLRPSVGNIFYWDLSKNSKKLNYYLMLRTSLNYCNR